jgi:hypothetical protein
VLIVGCFASTIREEKDSFLVLLLVAVLLKIVDATVDAAEDITAWLDVVQPSPTQRLDLAVQL